MKISVFKVHPIIITFLFLAFHLPVFAQTTAQQSPPSALKLSVLKKDKLLSETVLAANNEDSLVSTTKKGLFKCSKKKIVDPMLLKSMVTADGSERLTVIQLEDTSSIAPKDLSALKIRISPKLTSQFSKERIGSLEIDSSNANGIAYYYNHPTFKDSLSPSAIHFDVYVIAKDTLSLRGDEANSVDSANVLMYFSMPVLYPGIVMVHGLSSSNKEFKALSSFLRKKTYQPFQLNAFNYPDSLGFAKNMQVIPKAIDSLLKVMEDNHVSASKVDLNRAYNMAYIDVIIYDLKNNGDFQLLLNDRKAKLTERKLSPRENEVMALLAKGLVYKDIAETLAITLGTLKQYIHIIYKKLGVSNKTEAINIYFNR